MSQPLNRPKLPKELEGWTLVAVVPTDAVDPGSRELWLQDQTGDRSIRVISVSPGLTLVRS